MNGNLTFAASQLDKSSVFTVYAQCCTFYSLCLQCCFSPPDVAVTLNGHSYDAVVFNYNLCNNKNDKYDFLHIHNVFAFKMKVIRRLSKAWLQLRTTAWNWLLKKVLLLRSCYENYWSYVSPAFVATVRSRVRFRVRSTVCPVEAPFLADL